MSFRFIENRDIPKRANEARKELNQRFKEHGVGYQRCNLPEELIQLHKSLSDTEHRALDALRDHSEIILGKIYSTIGDLHLGRDSLVQQVMEHLKSNQIVLISGVAGSGKSVIVQDTINLLAGDHLVFSFRAEEFAHPHRDQTLRSLCRIVPKIRGKVVNP